MAYVNYMEVGKEVLATTLGGTMAGALHFMFLEPQFPGQMYGVNVATIVDLVIAFIIGIGTTLYAKTALTKIVGFGLAGTLGAIGLLQQFGLIPTVTPAIRVTTAVRPVRTNLSTPVRTTALGSYQVTA